MTLTSTKVPAAVVWLGRPNGRVLALTVGSDFSDWRLPGGDWKDSDGPRSDGTHDLTSTAMREVMEKTGVYLERYQMRRLRIFTNRSSRTVCLFVVDPVPGWIPERFP